MKNRFLLAILGLIVFGTLLSCGIAFLRTDIRMFYIVEGGLLAAVIFFIILYRRLVRPYRIISDTMSLLREQDFSSRLRPTADVRANGIIDVFNRILDQLKNERLTVREKNHFMDLLIEASPMGVIILDFDNRLTNINPAGARMLNIGKRENPAGKKLEEINSELSPILAGLESDKHIIYRSADAASYRCTRSSFYDKGFAHPFIMVEELTVELERAEKGSYERVIRMMAHEVNNSVAVVASNVNLVLSELERCGDPELRDCLASALERCMKMSSFVNNFAEVLRIPDPRLQVVSLGSLVRSVEKYVSVQCREREIELLVETPGDSPHVKADTVQFEQVLVNIVKNSCEAIGRGGQIKLQAMDNPPCLIVEDNGCGITPEVREKLFTPFFSTKPSGKGLGLILVREVLSRHGCRFDLRTSGGKTRFTIYF